MAVYLDPTKYYRLPWNLTDNAISWLEPTWKCNLYCEGCYRINDPQGHKSLEKIREELNIFLKYRKSDGVSIAGGDPLVHPQIVEIVKMVAETGLKPIINTNGIALTRELLKELKAAGVKGFTFHIDSKQRRPHWKNKTELELNELREYYAEMLYEEGGLSCAFNSTVYEDTLEYVPDLLDWAHKHIDKVHVMVFIAFRAATLDGRFDYYAGARKVNLEGIPYTAPEDRKLDITSNELYELLKKRFPEFDCAAYLNGTDKPDSFKWLLSGRIGTPEKIYGYVGPRFIELAQTYHHLRYGRYLAYTDPKVLRRGKAMLLLSPFDSKLKAIARNYFLSVMTNPLRLFKPLHFQSIMFIQPIDLLEDGSQNMCDGCPDMTVLNGKLVWSCRIEEPLQYGCFVRTVPKTKSYTENLSERVDGEIEST
ncbi:MAG: radical SAM protein [Calditrichaeota bacterium]|nr:MAG: radical SAM protein [Calditrichota bacterium]